MKQKIFLFILKFLSLIILGVSLCFITFMWWRIFASWYLNLTQPVGGDYYTGLTYALKLANHSPLPPAGWLEFWNAGTPIIGGYQWLNFYLIKPFLSFFDPYTALDVSSATAILLYILSSHLLFWQIAKNHAIAIGLSLVNLTSQSVYYQLTVGGMITGSSMQFYLPLSLFFLFRYLESTRRIRSLILMGIVDAISLIHHPAMSILFVIAPTFIIFSLRELTSTSNRRMILLRLLVYVLLILSVGAVGIFPFLFSMSFAETASKCDNSQCWGIYPLHIERWLGWLPLWLVVISLLLSLGVVVIRKILGHSTSLKFLIGPLVALVIVILYPVAAYLHLIPTLVNSIFPRRMFWAILLLSLVFTAHVYRLVRRSNRNAGWGFSLIFIVTLTLVLPLRLNSSHFVELNPPLTGDRPNAVPNYVYQWLIPKYKTSSPISEFLPEWLLKSDPAYRFDSLNAAVIHWWNIVSPTPATRGYTSGFNFNQSSWAHFLQTSLHRQQPDTVTQTLQLNRIKYMLDAYAVRYAYLQDYHPDITGEAFVEHSENNFSEFTSQISTPIIFPTTTPPILFVGDDSGYTTFIRSLADINFNSQRIIPVKGPSSIDSLDSKTLSHFPALFLYRFEGNLQKLDSYLTKGGHVFIELGSLKKIPKKTDLVLPFTRFEVRETTQWQLTPNDSAIFENVDTNRFAPLKYQESPWKLSVSNSQDLKPETEVLLSQEDQALVTSLKYGKGYLLVSGINLPYHLIEYHNEDEANLFANILNGIVPLPPPAAKFEVKRPTPEKITIIGDGISGVYFKENFHPGWKAYLDNKPVKVYPAGLHFMYVPTNKEAATSATLTFDGTLMDWALFYGSLVSLVGALIAVISPKLVLFMFHKSFRPLNKLFFRSTTRWQKDEHEQY